MSPRPDDGVRAGGLSPKWRGLRLVFLASGVASLIAGLWGGLERIGLTMPGNAINAAEWHGALMISGFLGTVISLERAVALGRWLAYVAPALSAAGAVALIAGVPGVASGVFLLAGIALTVNSAVVVMRQPALFTIVLTIAAACWLGGTVAWVGGASSSYVAGWWLTFLILTIAGERLELSRLLSPPRSSQFVFVLAAALIITGMVRGELANTAAPFAGTGLLVLTAWLLRYDIARRTIRVSGQPRFTAACLLAGYFWLGSGGLLLLVVPPSAAAFSYDAAIHVVAIGFVLSMIFGHAPIILPAVLGVRIAYNPAAYVPLGLLYISVLLRVAADLLERIEIRALSGPLTIIALAGYAAMLALASRKRRTV